MHPLLQTKPPGSTDPGRTNLVEAQAILGKNFYPLKEALGHFLIELGDEERATLDAVPFSPQTLRKYRFTHSLVPGLPVSIMDIRSDAAVLFQEFPAKEPWYDQRRTEYFADKPMHTGWKLIRSGGVPNTGGKSREDQLKRLPTGHYVPFSCELLFTLALRYLRTRELPIGGYLRTCDLRNDGRHLYVATHYGSFDNPPVLHVYSDEGGPSKRISLASAIRCES